MANCTEGCLLKEVQQLNRNTADSKYLVFLRLKIYIYDYNAM